MGNKHVAVLMGGWSSEREVSLSSGHACAEGLRNAGYKVTEVDVDRKISSVLRHLNPDVAFNALHGPFGEDGLIQGVLEFLNIPYTHSGVLASALAMDKDKAKRLAKTRKIPIAEHMIIDRVSASKKHVMKPPYVIKPVAEGSSYGVLIVQKDQEHPPQELTREDWLYSEYLMAERFVDGRELTCAVMGNVALGVTEIVSPGEKFYNYEAKYSEGGSKHILPAEIKPKIYQEIQKLSLEAHQLFGCRGVTRSDFRLDDGLMGSGELVWLEINTQPGMTPTSLLPELAAHSGHSWEELLTWIVEDASCNR